MPNLVIVTGLPRAGKSRVGLLTSHILGIWPEGFLDTDTLRKQAIQKGLIPYEFRYSREYMEMVYDIMISQAQERLADGLDVVMSATFTNQKRLREVHRLAEQTESKLHIFLVNCDEVTIKARLGEGIPLTNDGSNGSDLPSVLYPTDDSEAGTEVYQAIKGVFLPPNNPSLTIDGTEHAEVTLKALNSYFFGFGGNRPILAF